MLISKLITKDKKRYFKIRMSFLIFFFFVDLQIKQILGDLFSAGMETIKSSLMWMLVFMLRNPEIKKRVQEELDAVVGHDRLPSLEDMPNLPYTEVTILESLRMSSIVPLGTTHSPTKYVLFLTMNLL